MDSSERLTSMPTAPVSSHRPPLIHHHHHLEFSPHCPLHGGFLLHPNSHHHHHLELSPDCPLHRFLVPHCPLHHSNIHSSANSTTSFPNFVSPIYLPQNPHFPYSQVTSLPEADENSKSEARMMQETTKEVEAEDGEDIIFVLTDEWKEFFAKSEAKRRQAKKQAKKKGKY